MNPATLALIVIALGSTFGCTSAPPPSNVSISRVRLSVCDLARYVDYVGRFEVLEIAATKAGGQVQTELLRSTNLRLQSVVLGQPPNENSAFVPQNVALARAPELARVRELKVGQEFRAELELPRNVEVGDAITVFLTYSTVFRVWADASGQGVFFRNGLGLMENSMVYAGEKATTEADLLSEIRRGSQLSRTGSPRCDDEAIAVLPSDAGADAADGGR